MNKSSFVKLDACLDKNQLRHYLERADNAFMRKNMP